ncbi:DUF3880 domain-containing protein [Acinetobacter sp. C32I]|uniref:CgeB family protein n=1 Tax=Acinetobacter sp. C32I TaxID=2950074 RepID=UPI002037405C|nr:glycosyltransferase [Acinetobacter sp. C32I]USA52759.1 DUF3880 domain-containing protein [Acinetobacter sp. C32I]
MKKLKILCLLDSLTYTGLKMENNIILFPMLRNIILNKFFNPDLILVESAWFGYRNIWKHKLVNFPDKKADLKIIVKMLEWANEKKIPVIFWNKEDPIHFEKFQECANLFEYVATTDSNCIEKYSAAKGSFYLPFAYQPRIHNFKITDINNRSRNGIFMGSYLTNNHPNRKAWQDSYFPIFSKYGLDIYDRNSKLKNKNYQFPSYDNVRIFDAVEYKETGKVMRNYLYSINVNSITNSPTMFSRRILESIASGCIVFSNKSEAIDNLFPDCCLQIENKDQLEFHLENIRNGNTSEYNEMRKHAYDLIEKKYSYENWIKIISDEMGLKIN